MGCYSFTFVNTTKHTEKLWNEAIYVKLTVIIMFSKPHRTEMAKLIQPVIFTHWPNFQSNWINFICRRYLTCISPHNKNCVQDKSIWWKHPVGHLC